MVWLIPDESILEMLYDRKFQFQYGLINTMDGFEYEDLKDSFNSNMVWLIQKVYSESSCKTQMFQFQYGLINTMVNIL